MSGERWVNEKDICIKIIKKLWGDCGVNMKSKKRYRDIKLKFFVGWIKNDYMYKYSKKYDNKKRSYKFKNKNI